MKNFEFKKEKGQAMVEFALVLPILFLLIGGIIDFGWIFHNQITANNACREAARYLAIHYYYPGGGIEGNNIQADDKATAIIGDTFSAVKDPSNTENVKIDTEPDDLVNGEKVTVTLNVEIDILTPFLSTILGDDKYTISSECTMRIEK